MEPPPATVQLSPGIKLDQTPPMATDAADTMALPTDKPVATAYALGYMKALLAAAGG